MDLIIFNAFHSLAGQAVLFDWFFMFSASYLGPILLIATAILFFRHHQQRFHYGVLAILSLLLSRGLIVEIIRFFYNRPRPFLSLDFIPLIAHDATAAFPSGHAAFYFALALVVWQMNRRWGKWFFAGVGLMALARIVVGVHWPSDIVMGAIVGLLSVWLVEYLLPQRGINNPQPTTNN